VKKIDVATRAISNLPVPIEMGDQRQIAVSPDAKYIYWSERHAEGDIWRVTIAEP